MLDNKASWGGTLLFVLTIACTLSIIIAGYVHGHMSIINAYETITFLNESNTEELKYIATVLERTSSYTTARAEQIDHPSIRQK